MLVNYISYIYYIYFWRCYKLALFNLVRRGRPKYAHLLCNREWL